MDRLLKRKIFYSKINISNNNSNSLFNILDTKTIRSNIMTKEDLKPVDFSGQQLYTTLDINGENIECYLLDVEPDYDNPYRILSDGHTEWVSNIEPYKTPKPELKSIDDGEEFPEVEE